MTAGSGSLDSITGAITANDLADLYCIFIPNPAQFSATTVGTGGTLVDTQLFLFNANGFGVEANDDSVGPRSTLPASALPPAPQAPGIYYLAISDFDQDPVSPGGEIFPDIPFAGVHGPTGPGGGQALTGFNLAILAQGTYTINLTGATFCEVPEPTTVVLLGIGLAGLFIASRHRKKK
jgi:hypothetical protein